MTERTASRLRVVLALVLVATASLIVRLEKYPGSVRPAIFISASATHMAIAAGFRARPSWAGRYHLPTFEEATKKALAAGETPLTWPEPPKDAPESEWRAEHNQDIGYGVVMGALFALTGTNDLRLMLGLQLVADLAILLLLSWTAGKLAGRAASVLAPLGYALFDNVGAQALGLNSYLWPVFGLAVAFAFLTWISVEERQTKRLLLASLGVGLLLALVATMRSSALPLAPALGALVLLTKLPLGKRCAVAGALALTFALGLLPLALRNKAEFGELGVRRGIMWHTILHGVLWAERGPVGDEDTYAFVVARHGPLDYAAPEYDRACRVEAERYFQAHPGFYRARALEILGSFLLEGRKLLRTRLGPFYLAFDFVLVFALAGWLHLLATRPALRAALLAPLVFWLANDLPVALVLMPLAAPYTNGGDVAIVLALGVGAGHFFRLQVRGESLRGRAELVASYGAGFVFSSYLWLLAARFLGEAVALALPLALQSVVAFFLGVKARSRLHVLGLVLYALVAPNWIGGAAYAFALAAGLWKRRSPLS